MSTTAFATNWVMTHDFGCEICSFIDTDSAVQKDGVLLFWYGLKFSNPLILG